MNSKERNCILWLSDLNSILQASVFKSKEINTCLKNSLKALQNGLEKELEDLKNKENKITSDLELVENILKEIE